MKRSSLERFGFIIAITALATLLGGCSSPQMKGTPFYTGEYSVRTGPPEDRINIWPLLYYRDPALSVLWPIGELTDDHLAVRPLISVYGLDQEKKIYNVLWPLAQFDNQHDKHRIFPFYWGNDYVAAFPLYWHFGSDNNQSTTDSLIPAWWYRRNGDNRTVHILPPVFNWKNAAGEKGWRVWPLIGAYEEGDDNYSFLLWPLGHRWARANGRDKAHMFLLIPLFYSSRVGGKHTFISLPWSSGAAADGAHWQLAPPFMYRRSRSGSDTLITPLFAQGSNAAEESRWQSVIPLYYRSEKAGEKTLATLLGGYSTDKSGHRWLIYPLLSGGKRGEQGGQLWIAAPLFHAGWDTEGKQSHLFPLYYWDNRSGTFVSPLAARWTNAQRQEVTLVPPLLSWMADGEKRDDLWALGGLAHWSWGEKAGSRHVFPLFYADPAQHTTISPLYAAWKEGSASYHAIPPLLSGKRIDGERTDTVALAGIFHNRSGKSPSDKKGHLLPLYYYEGSDLLLTPLCGWNKDGTDGFFYPLTPIAGVRRGDHSGSWIFPFYSHSRDKTSGRIDDSFLLWGDYTRDANECRSDLFPIYSYRDRIEPADAIGKTWGTYGKRFDCLAVMRYRNEVNVTPYRGKGDRPEGAPPAIRTEVRKNTLFPLWSYDSREVLDQNRRNVNGSLLFKLYDYKHEIIPGSQDPESIQDYTRRRILWRLWHYEKVNDDVSVDVFPAITYDRRGEDFKKFSFLWRFFRYERDENGKDIDILFIPVTRKE